MVSRVFPEDYQRVKSSVFDPRGPAARKWNKLFLAAGLVSLFVDPLFFFLPVARPEFCFEHGISLQIPLTIIRSVCDVFYIVHIAVQFRTAYVAPSSRVFGRGELVIDPWKIAYRYLVKGFWADFMAAIPLPQVLVWAIIPNLADSATSHTLIVLRFTLLFQYFLRLALIYPLSSQIVNATGEMTTETAWVGAAYNMMLYLLASHVSGSIYYLLTVERQQLCWRSVCSQESLCEYRFLDCSQLGDPGRSDWFNSTNVTTLCNPSDSYYLWGIYQISVSNGATTSSFLHKYFFCLWIGIQALCSIGQTYTSSIFTGESIYCIANSSVGLILLALLIGNMQRYLQSITARLEEWRQKKTDTEQWMHHRQLPHELRQAVREYGQFKWVATQGVDEETLLNSFPADLQREIKRHLCLNLVRQVPLLDQMDARMLDAICERLKPAFCTKGTFLLLEGDPVDEMYFIIRGHLESYTTNGGRTGFFNSSSVGPGDFCGEELLSWALNQRHSDALPLSTRTVEATSEVEAFRLTSEDLNFVASQFRRLHSRELIHKFRFYSHQWRTWAACFIQAAWRRYKRRRGPGELGPIGRPLTTTISDEMEIFVPKPGSGLEVYSARLMHMRRAASKNTKPAPTGLSPLENQLQLGSL
ncbi:putative cyclic nucleotide-gated ion channel 15 [Sarracenia purpurea var. burkii]